MGVLDLIAAAVLMLLASLASGWAGYRLATAARITALTASATVLGIVWYVVLLRDHPFLVRLVPTSALPILANPLPVLGAGLVGMLWKQTASWWRSLLLALPVLIFAWEGPVRVLMNHPPVTTPDWSEGVALQSTRSTCSAAATATLLMHHGIEADESQMAELCLTDHRGTSLLGMHRGLRIMTRKTPWRPQVATLTLDELRSDAIRLPAVLSMQLTAEVLERDPRYGQEWGWDLGVIHTVVIYGFTEDGRAEIGDPGVGREFWSIEGVRDLWTGETTWLAKRSD